MSGRGATLHASGDLPSIPRPRAGTADFRLTYTGTEFVWAGETRPGLPILRWPDGSLCEPIVLYFGYSAEVGRVAVSSMQPEAYALREWLSFLWARGIPWDRPTDGLLRDWREEQRRRRREQTGGNKIDGAPLVRDPSDRQIERKIECVFEFYRRMPDAQCLGPELRPPRVFVGPPGAAGRFPLSSKEAAPSSFGRRASGPRWEGAARVAKASVGRVTPATESVARILAHIRSRAASAPTGRRTASAEAQSRLRSERDWLIARCEVEAGLRAEEVARLEVSALAKALAEEGIGSRRLAGPGGLAGLACDPESRNVVLRAIDEHAAAGRQVIGVKVTCKGRSRRAPFPVELMRDLIEIGVWTVRNAQVHARHGAEPAPLLFLSFKTGGGLLPGTVGDIVMNACVAAGIMTSGHRLRAYYATEMALRLLEERLRLNSGVYDAMVENWVLEHVAEALGHSQITTTVRHYVDRALLRLLASNPRQRRRYVEGPP